MNISYRRFRNIPEEAVAPYIPQANEEGLTFKPGTAFIGAFLEDDTLAGFVGLKVRGTQGTLRNLYVMPPYRKQGISTGLIKACLQLAVLRGARTVIVFSNPNSRPIFERLGATVLDERRFYGKLRFDLAP